MSLFRKKKHEYIKCVHCNGTGKCSCGFKVFERFKEASCGVSLKTVLGIDCLCLGVCDSCRGRGWHKRELYEKP